jgi:hypothetical protein
MENEELRKQGVARLGEAEVNRLEHYSVESQKARYSDEYLWAWLLSIYGRKIEILMDLPVFHRWGHSGLPDQHFWLRQWERLILELNSSKPVSDCIVWHLTKRGDTAISDWLQECDDYIRENSLQWQLDAWRLRNG